MINSTSPSTAKAVLFFSVFAAFLIRPATAQQTIYYTNGMVNSNPIYITNGANPTTLNIVSGSATQSGAIIQYGGVSGAIYKTGAGTVVLTSTNSYAGGTMIEGGTLAVQGGSISQSSASVYAGYYTNSALMISAGGLVNSTNGFIGYQNGTNAGTATVTGVNTNGVASTWNNSGNTYVGYSGTGNLNVQNGGKVTDTTGYIGFGYYPGSNGTATVDGVNANGKASTWSNSGNLYVGYGATNSGTGTLAVQNGGQVSSADSYLGFSSGSSGIATVTGGVTTNGAASSWTYGSLHVGESGTGTLNILNGGQVTPSGGSGAVNVAVQPGSVGSVYVDGSGSHLEATSMSVGGSSSTLGGLANFSLTNSGTAHVATTLTTGQQGSILITSGALTVGSISTPAAIGTAQINSGGTLGGSGQITGNVVVNGGTIAPGDPATFTVNGNLTLGNGGLVQLAIAGANSADYDHLDINGTLSLGSGSILQLDFINGFAPTAGETFDFIDYGTLDPNANTFSTVELEGLAPGFDYSLTSNGADSFSLTALNDAILAPEPSGWAMLLGGLGLLAFWRHRRGRERM